jgi:hypothetical protein
LQVAIEHVLPLSQRIRGLHSGQAEDDSPRAILRYVA